MVVIDSVKAVVIALGTKVVKARSKKGACYNYGIEGHFTSECRKPNENKAFIGRAWSDSEDGDEHQNDATCLMSINSQEAYDGGHVIFGSNLKGKVVVGGGYSQPSKAYIVLNKETMRIEESLNVTFDESLPEPKSSSSVEDDRIIELVVQNPVRSPSLQVNA
ncbi:hypothetical protein Tco_0989570 [Tanacetum coccineum]|uniref:Retroviral polymerase SH3-like domain-containing protein n=1 Tax=Tanacetum coccineum TaxID=301880 RepID=A0ABQ5EU10_9ASTR